MCSSFLSEMIPKASNIDPMSFLTETMTGPDWSGLWTLESDDFNTKRLIENIPLLFFHIRIDRSIVGRLLFSVSPAPNSSYLL
ncbi:hypothetical protein L6452_04480 [Arctium lappa]|uniref:Uncharacterized protein n=1 Tax=Arctium lappa TaxID=4217 RepID=A0ACB9EED0_ARCLA|nr:hypothetical protein L6452_04480 [Arctium lappa]